MPDWIAATLLVFGVVLASALLSAALVAGFSLGYVRLTASLVAVVFFVGVPTFFYVMLR